MSWTRTITAGSRQNFKINWFSIVSIIFKVIFSIIFKVISPIPIKWYKQLMHRESHFITTVNAFFQFYSIKAYVIIFVADQFSVASIVHPMSNSSFQWCEIAVIDFDIVFTISCESIFFWETATTILEWSEDCCCNMLIVAL